MGKQSQGNQDIEAFNQAKKAIPVVLEVLKKDLRKRSSPFTRDARRRMLKKGVIEKLKKMLEKIQKSAYNEIDVGDGKNMGSFKQTIVTHGRETEALKGPRFKGSFALAKQTIESCVRAAQKAQQSSGNHFKKAEVSTDPLSGEDMMFEDEIQRRQQRQVDRKAHAEKLKSAKKNYSPQIKKQRKEEKKKLRNEMLIGKIRS